MKTILSLLFIIPLFLGATSPFLSDGEIETQLQGAIHKAFRKKIRVEIASISVAMKVPKGARLTVDSPKPPIGVVSFHYSWKEDNKRKVARGSAVVKVYAHITVSKARIPHGGRFTSGNILLEERELGTHIHGGYFCGLDELVSLQARGLVPQGSVLSRINTELAPTVRRNQAVDLVYRDKRLKVTAKVRALQDGKMGDWIRVRNPETNKEMLAQVVGERELRVQ